MSNNPTGSPASPGKPRKSSRRPSSKNVGARFGAGAYVENSAERHQGRVLAMQTLFEIDSVNRGLEDIIQRIRFGDAEVPDSVRESVDEDEDSVDEIPTSVADHAESLARGVVSHQAEIDPIIEKAAPAFPISQIALVDRNVLRLAIYELNHEPLVPFKVVINEAVEIAKRFGGPNSGKFVNGVLGTIVRELPEARRTP